MDKIGFKKVESNSKVEYSPESIFRDIRGKSPDIKGIWSHQADILRQYQMEYQDSHDVSLELPTGAGKTLVGILLGLYRRKKFGEKILYLCPTKQLAYQVLAHSKDYNIKCHLFIGKQKDYLQKEFSEYQTGEAIAISTYSSLFNIKPRFDTPDIIIFDDAHASENYISSFWSLEINRFDNKDIFFKIISLFENMIPKYLLRSIGKENPNLRERKQVDMIPEPYYWDRLENLRDIFEENIVDGENLFFQWQNMQKNLESCILYISWYEILIRPWIPPTLTHLPFSKAKQRIYMSATLGSGGELERIIGVPKIDRIKIPSGWEKQGSGRRFFIFPDYSFTPKEYFPWLIDLINKFDRSLVLCPDFQTINDFKKICLKLGMKQSILTAKDIEDNLDCFSGKTNTVLILANRYDGLDLPGDTCRHLMLNNLPIAVNIQERFLHDRLSIISLLKDRIATRITQASGRTTRGDSDFSLITIVGRRLFDFCANKSNRFVMHPELQAEIEFGIDQSNVKELKELSLLIDLFIKQEEQWKEADNNIRQLRNGFEKNIDDQTKTLNSIVKDEVNYQYQLWNNNYELALTYSRRIIDKLPQEKFEGYRGLWCYNAGNVSRKLAEIKSSSEIKKTSDTYYQEATNCSKTISWFSEFLNIYKTKDMSLEIDLFSSYAVEKIQENLSNLGGIGTLFEKKIDEIKELINKNDSKPFELGLTELGKLLGFEAYHPKVDSYPDSVWRLGDRFAMIFEEKSDDRKTIRGDIESLNSLGPAFGVLVFSDRIKNYTLHRFVEKDVRKKYKQYSEEKIITEIKNKAEQYWKTSLSTFEKYASANQKYRIVIFGEEDLLKLSKICEISMI
ncbi:DEAD/DEAH box helicase family protein [Thermoplasmatota archaeon]